jgi:hypothetical protein
MSAGNHCILKPDLLLMVQFIIHQPEGTGKLTADRQRDGHNDTDGLASEERNMELFMHSVYAGSHLQLWCF